MAHLTNFSFEFFYKIFTEDASQPLLYHGAKKVKNDQKLKSRGSCLNLYQNTHPDKCFPKGQIKRISCFFFFLSQEYFAQRASTRADNSFPQNHDVIWVQIVSRWHAEYRPQTRFSKRGKLGFFSHFKTFACAAWTLSLNKAESTSMSFLIWESKNRLADC